MSLREIYVLMALATIAPLGCGGGSGGEDVGGSPSGVEGGAAHGGSHGGGTSAHNGDNAASPMGTNLNGIFDSSTEQPFVDVFKTSRPWMSGTADSWDGGQALDLDEHGWVRSLQPGQVARTVMLWNQAQGGIAGRYLVEYEGQGTIEYFGAATIDAAASTPGRDVVDVVDAPDSGFGLLISAVDPANPLRNIRVFAPGGVCANDPFRACDDASGCGGGSCLPFEQVADTQRFNPRFLDRIRSFALVRFMDWMATNNSTVSTWADRPKLDDARWSEKGVPAEVLIDLANVLGADPWLCVPHLADDGYVTNLAGLVADELDPGLQVWVEHSNEVWNGMFDQSDYCQERGQALGLASDAFEAGLRYHARRSVEIFRLFEAALGGTERLVRVMGSQAANSWVSEVELGTEGAAAQTDALAIAPYFGGGLGTPDQASRVHGLSLDGLFAEIDNVAIPEALGWVEAQAAVASAQGVRLVAYEGGQHLTGVGGSENDDALNALFDAANGDPRMKQAYLTYLAGWRDAGGELMAHFNNCSHWSKHGRWGSLQYMTQPREQAPKYDAIQTFISQNPRWW